MSGVTKKSISDLLGRTRAANEELRSGIESIRRRIADLNQQRTLLRGLPVSFDVAAARADVWVDQREARGQQHAPTADRFTWAAGYGDGPEYLRDDAAMIFAYLGPLVKEAIRGKLAEIYKQAPGISEDERAEKLDFLDRELLDAELTEESIIRAAEQAGFPIHRRANADPRVVLAPDEDMP